MTHHSRLGAVVIDVPPGEHSQELELWRAAAGQPLTRSGQYPEYHGGRFPPGRRSLLVQRLGDRQGRVLPDIHTDEVARVEGLGAQRVRRVQSWQHAQRPQRAARTDSRRSLWICA